MKYIDEYRDAKMAEDYARAIYAVTTKPWTLMEVCGGLASALVEIAEAANVLIRIDENSIPVREDVQGACEILGFDPLYLANEGRFVAFVAAPDARRALDILGSHPLGNGSCLIGKVTNDSSPAVVMRSRIGATRIVDMLCGEQLPRIC
jgi:hydrogenase expression/formation protein HypE